MKLKTCLLFACFVSLAGPVLAAPSAESKELEVDDQDANQAVEAYGQTRRHYDLSRLSDRHLDGVKGYTFSSVSEPPVAAAGGLADPYLGTLRQLACSRQVFGEAELVGKKSFAGRHGYGVFTKYRFKMISDFRDGKKSAKVVHVIIPGGEIDYQGEKVRVENAAGDFNVGSRYVLVAGSKRADERETLFYSIPHMEISSNTIYSADGWAPFESGTNVKRAKADVAKALSLKGCPQ
jgi:hypothetical protein